MSALAALKLALGDRSVITIEDLEIALKEQRAFVWSGSRSAVFVGVHDYPAVGERVASAGPAAGDMHEILNGIPDMERLAKLCGCTQAQVHMGRDGWSKKLRAHGYEPYTMIMRKFL